MKSNSLQHAEPAKLKTDGNKPAVKQTNSTKIDGNTVEPTGVVRGRRRRETFLPAKFRDGAYSAQITQRQAASTSVSFLY